MKRIAARYRGRSTYKSYGGMSHWLIGEPNWRRVADDALAWLADKAKR